MSYLTYRQEISLRLWLVLLVWFIWLSDRHQSSQTNRFISLPRAGGFSLSLEIGRDFVAISAELHAAPIARMVLRRVVKVQDTRRVLAFLDQRRIGRGQQITPRHRQRCQQLIFAGRRGDKVLLEVLAIPHDFPIALA
jgi:hypothetical protein